MSKTHHTPGHALLARVEKADAEQNRIGRRITHVASDQKAVLKSLHTGFQRLGAGAVARLRASAEHEEHRRQREVGRQAAGSMIARTLRRAREDAAREERERLAREARPEPRAAAAPSRKTKSAKAKAKAKPAEARSSKAKAKAKPTKAAKRATKRNPSHARLPARARTSHGFVL